MDYLVADDIVIPDGERQHYTEHIIYLPDSYQANDAARPIAARLPTRAELGLPATGFVYCCFNNNFKITPELFSSWMRILSAVDGSVLWLLADSPTAATNLRREVSRRGVDPARLVFAQRTASAEHLARHHAADLFLDTVPYNAHTTASDALWAGVPVLTRSTRAFAGRVAASLLHAVGLAELVADSRSDYEALAISLAHDAPRLASLRVQLAARHAMPLFDTSVFTADLERAYEHIVARHGAGKPPADVRVISRRQSTAP